MVPSEQVEYVRVQTPLWCDAAYLEIIKDTWQHCYAKTQAAQLGTLSLLGLDHIRAWYHIYIETVIKLELSESKLDLSKFQPLLICLFVRFDFAIFVNGSHIVFLHLACIGL